MAHQIQTMAYAGQTPWHHLGQRLDSQQSLDDWARAAGMTWSIREAPVRYMAGEADDAAASGVDLAGSADASGGSLLDFAEQKVLYRSDNREPLSIVSARYQVVQPREVLEFYRDLTEASGYELETAGVLKGGRKFWALAHTGKSTQLKGSDIVRGYLLLATSCDGSLATVAMPTTVRVVCANTLAIALDAGSEAIRVPHSTSFDAQAVKQQLGVAVSRWDGFMYRMKGLAERPVKSTEAEAFIRSVFSPAYAPAAVGDSRTAGTPGAVDPVKVANERALNKVLALFNGQGRGAELAAAKGTAWGLLNAVTEFVDHERRARNQDYRMDSAWFGQGSALKRRALNRALDMVD